MDDGSVILQAVVEIRDEARGEFLGVARDLAAASREEDGVLAYDVLEDPERPGRFVFLERYRDNAALEAHLGTPTCTAYLFALPRWLARPADAQVLEARLLDTISVTPVTPVTPATPSGG